MLAPQDPLIIEMPHVAEHAKTGLESVVPRSDRNSKLFSVMIFHTIRTERRISRHVVPTSLQGHRNFCLRSILVASCSNAQAKQKK